jgi:hypothetical protein
VVALPALFVAAGVAVQVPKLAGTHARHAQWHDAAEWTRQHTAPDTVLALKDAGLFGWFSERPVVNLDGKANGYRYLEHLERGDVVDYLEQVGVSHVADVSCAYSDGRCMFGIPRASDGALLLCMPQRGEVYRGGAAPTRMFQAGHPSGDASRFTIARVAPRDLRCPR